MNETTIQALIRLGRVLVVTLLVFVGENATDLLAFIEDPMVRTIVLSGIVAVIEAILKAIGGATEPPSVTRGRTADGTEAAVERPNALAI